MSALQMPQSLLCWDTPPSHGGLRSLQPVFVLDLQIYWQNKKGIEQLFRLQPLLETATDDDFDELNRLLSGVLRTIDGYLKVRGTGSLLLRKIRAQRPIIVDAIESIKRGYAPGTMPKPDDRI